MKKEKSQKVLLSGIAMVVLFILWTVAISLIDVQPIGPQNSSVGFATLNGFIHSLTGVHMAIYTVTDWLGLIPLCFILGFALLGLIQLIKRKSLFKVDSSILVLGAFYIVVMAAYLFFEFYVVNYRPVLINGFLEASYPSSTTLLVMCVMPTAVMQLNSRIRNTKMKRAWSDRNLPLLPTMVTAFANSKAWWKCKDCGNEWYTLISTRSGGSRCPYCSGYTLLKGFNDLATTHPDLAAEWSERNYPLMPDEVNAKSRHNVWWKCKTCGNEWKSVINARVKGTVCPVCADRAVLAGYNDLATTDRKLLAEWDYEKNSLLPTQVSRKSMKSVWWKCSLGHSWKAKISDRTIIGEKCTVCENEYRSVFPGLAVAYYANQKGLKVQLGSDKLLGIPLETYIPSEKLAIEFTNGSEHMEVLKSHLCKQRNIKLVKLPFKTTETEAEYADRVKAVFKSVHIFIYSDVEADVSVIRAKFNEWRKRL